MEQYFVMRTPPYPSDPQPDPRFQQRLSRILQRWRSTELPYQEALKALQALAQEAQLTGQVLHQSMACNSIAHLYSTHGLFDQAIQAMQDSLSLLELCGARGRANLMMNNMSEVHLSAGRYDEARVIAQEALERAQALEYPFGILLALDHLGCVAVRQGNYAEACEKLTQVLQLSSTPVHENPTELDKRQLAAFRSVILSELAHALLALGDLSGAADYICRACDEGQNSQPIALGYAYRVLGDFVTQAGRAPKAELSDDPDRHYQQAVASFRGVDADVEVAHTYMRQAASLEKRGQKSHAQQALHQAIILYQRLGLKEHAQRAERARTALR